MNSKYKVVDIITLEDINNIDSNTKYINLDITMPNNEIIAYLLANGENYSYSDLTYYKRGYIYVSYSTFKNSEELIKNIINKIPSNFNELEKARFIYITLGKLLGFDINTISEKNDTISFSNLSLINNIWGSLQEGKTTNVSLCKLYLYLCKKVGINCDIINTNDEGHLANRLFIDDKYLFVDLTKDLPNISGGFSTEYFASYNNDIKLDKKIGYIKNDYSENIIHKLLHKLDYTTEDAILVILNTIKDIINIKAIGALELSQIYQKIFDEYCPNYDININNLYVYDTQKNKEHFIIISYNNKHYSFNYIKNSFILLKDKELLENIKNEKIGIYNNEKINFERNELRI